MRNAGCVCFENNELLSVGEDSARIRVLEEGDSHLAENLEWGELNTALHETSLRAGRTHQREEELWS